MTGGGFHSVAWASVITLGLCIGCFALIMPHFMPLFSPNIAVTPTHLYGEHNRGIIFRHNSNFYRHPMHNPNHDGRTTARVPYCMVPDGRTYSRILYVTSESRPQSYLYTNAPAARPVFHHKQKKIRTPPENRGQNCAAPRRRVHCIPSQVTERPQSSDCGLPRRPPRRPDHFSDSTTPWCAPSDRGAAPQCARACRGRRGACCTDDY